MGTKLADMLVTVVTIVMAGCATWLGAFRTLPPFVEAWLAPPAQVTVPVAASGVDRLSAGQTLTVPGVDFSLSARTLLVVVRSDCRFCSASEPFYGELLKRQQGRSAALRLFLVAPADDPGFDTYMTTTGFAEEHRLQIPDALGVSGTPTLLLVNRDGQIENVWLGRLSPADETRVTDALF